MDSNPSSDQRQLQVHKAVFDKNLPQEIQQLIQTQKVLKILKEDAWYMCGKQFLDSKGNSIFTFMLSASCSFLGLYNNGYSQIIIDISKTSFLAVKQLNMSTNNISSIEQLQYIDMPCLRKLHLGCNKITRTNAFNKCNWSFLHYLRLNYNPIEQVDLSRLFIGNQVGKQKQYGGDKNTVHFFITVWAKTNFDTIKLWSRDQIVVAPRERQLKSLKQKGLSLRIAE